MERGEAEGFKTVVIYSGLGIGAATGVLFLVRHFITAAKRNNAEYSSSREGDPTNYAKQLHMAFLNDNYFGWGTDINLLLKVFNALPSKKFYDKVQKAYRNLYSKNLNEDLESELSSEEYNTVIRILGGKKTA